jgi:hypothetical protein
MNNNTREAKAIRTVPMTAVIKVTWLRPGLTVLYYRTYGERFSSYLTGYWAKKVRVAGPIGGFFFLRTAPQPIGRTD